MSGSMYDEDYFLRGRETGKSLYENYRWMPELTIPMAQAIVDHCGINKGARVLDFGCARGYLVKALRGLGYTAYGYDISEWAINNADPDVYHHLTCRDGLAFEPGIRYEWIIAKDVFEHVQSVGLTIRKLQTYATKGIFAVVPLSLIDDGEYVVKEYEQDITHIHRLTLTSWVKKFLRTGWSVEAAFRVPGVKDNYAQYRRGNGFLTVRKIGV